MARLTKASLTTALDECGGFGYSTAGNLEYDDEREGGVNPNGSRLVKILDAQVLVRANELGWSQEDLNVWVDSKWGRWMVDEASGLIDSATQDQALGSVALTEKCMSAEILADLYRQL